MDYMQEISRQLGDSGDIIIYVAKCKKYEFEPQPDVAYVKEEERVDIKLERFERFDKSC